MHQSSSSGHIYQQQGGNVDWYTPAPNNNGGGGLGSSSYRYSNGGNVSYAAPNNFDDEPPLLEGEGPAMRDRMSHARMQDALAHAQSWAST